KTMDEMEEVIDNKQWVYLWNKVKHPSIIDHMTFSTVRRFIALGSIKKAELNILSKEEHA
ncbi:MAG: hypothetical protein SV375_20540, partial [Thermodesulfobacteriota bacterium]|nr:hypothetical protein [Thermodesulfobacteriota bacterium]